MAYADHAQTTSLSCCRFDLSKPALVFGGLFIAVSAIYGSMGGLGGTPGTQNILDEVRILNAENVVGPVGIDPLAMNCDRDLKQSALNAKSTDSAGSQRRCRRHARR
jgi:hypothetical protein